MTKVHVVEVEKAKKTKKAIDKAWAFLGAILLTTASGLVVWFFWWLFSMSVLGGGIILSVVAVIVTLFTICTIEEKADKVLDDARVYGTVDD